jgi:hypothetical protein
MTYVATKINKLTIMALPDFNTFAIETPLYETFSLQELIDSNDINATYDYLNALKNPNHPIDLYCVECQRESTFRRSNNFILEHNGQMYLGSGDNEIFMVELSCTRNASHLLFFVFRILNYTISKIGQHHSIADINIEFIKKYKKVLGNEKFREFSKAIGLVTHGVGIGSFVYLRRIFEGLIFDAYEHIKDQISIGDFKAKRMDEKIELLKNHLPIFLVDNKSLYSILSVGIHTLTENECLNYFQTVKIGIELILDEKIDEINRKEKVEQIKKSLSTISSEIKK